MPDFRSIPPAETHGVALDIKRTPPGRPLEGISLSEDLTGCYTHWFGGRTVPHEQTNCAACAEGYPYRWHSYLVLHSIKRRETWLMEVPGIAAQTLAEFRQQKGTLRGVGLVFSRHGGRPNGRVSVRFVPLDLSGIVLPDAPDTIALLHTLWRLPRPQIQGNGRTAEGAALRILPSKPLRELRT